MYFVNVVEPYKVPDSSRVHLLKGIEHEKSLTFDEIVDITNSPYSNENWSKLCYFVSKNALRPYYNDDIGRIADRKIAYGDWIIDETSINCLFNETYLRHPRVCNWTRHFLFFSPNNFLGSLGLYALQLEADVTPNMALQQVAQIAQYQIVSQSPFNRFIVAISRPQQENWDIVFGQLVEEILPENFIKARKVRIFWFNNPYLFIQELLGGGKVNNVPHEEYEVKVRIK